MAATSGALGNVVNGGTMGNLTALAVALEASCPARASGPVRRHADAGHAGLAVIGSARSHYSVKKRWPPRASVKTPCTWWPSTATTASTSPPWRDDCGLEVTQYQGRAMIGIAGTTKRAPSTRWPPWQPLPHGKASGSMWTRPGAAPC
jgi:hypothetical protein